MAEQSLGFVFPGQGSQFVGMMSSLYAEYPIVQETFAEAATILSYDLWQLISEGPVQKLNHTEFTQPALLAAGVAVWRLWQQLNSTVQPQVLAGHSLGEYTALTCAGALQFADALKLVEKRGVLMRQAVAETTGAMAALLGLPLAKVLELCQAERAASGEVLEVANINSPEQIVIAGHEGAVQRGIAAARAAGAKRGILLPVSVPAHCSLMQPAAEGLKLCFSEMTWSEPKLSIICNFDAKVHTTVNAIQESLVKQLYNSVRWVDSIQTMVSKFGVSKIIECGPGKVLTGLNRRIDSTLSTFSIGELNALLDCGIEN